MAPLPPVAMRDRGVGVAAVAEELARPAGELRPASDRPARCCLRLCSTSSLRISSRCLLRRSSTFEIDVEPLAGPGHELLAVVALLALSVAGREVGQRRPCTGILGFLLVVGLRGACSRTSCVERARRRDFSTSSGSSCDAEFVLHPAAGGAHAEVLVQERARLRQVDLSRSPRGPFRAASRSSLSRPIFFRSRSRRFSFQRVLASLASASQFHSSGRRPRADSPRWRRGPALRPCGRLRPWRSARPWRNRGRGNRADRARRPVRRRPTWRRSPRRNPWRGNRPGSVSICASIISRIIGLQLPPSRMLLAVAVDALALLVHHLVVFEQVLADVEVAFFDLLLGAFDAAADHAAFDRLAFLHAQAGEHVRHPLAGEDAHQVVFQRQDRSGC